MKLFPWNIVEWLRIWWIVWAVEWSLRFQGVLCSWRTTNWNSRWDDWWNYQETAIGGPLDWGQKMAMAYKEDVWPICQSGRRQSPVNISVDHLVFDHTLSLLKIEGDSNQLQLRLTNQGQDLHILIENKELPILQGGPLSYSYRLFGALFKFGADSSRGSDHRVNNVPFPGELQFYAFNHILYANYSNALDQLHGIAVLSVFLTLGSNPTEDFRALISVTEKIPLKGQTTQLNGALLRLLLPPLTHYLTYEGSLPFPGCHETATWILLNQPLEITETQLKTLRKLRISRSERSRMMADNFRPVQALNGRSVRTNINLSSPNEFCTVKKDFSYQANLPTST